MRLLHYLSWALQIQETVDKGTNERKRKITNENNLGVVFDLLSIHVIFIICTHTGAVMGCCLLPASKNDFINKSPHVFENVLEFPLLVSENQFY